MEEASLKLTSEPENEVVFRGEISQKTFHRLTKKKLYLLFFTIFNINNYMRIFFLTLIKMVENVNPED